MENKTNEIKELNEKIAQLEERIEQLEMDDKFKERWLKTWHSLNIGDVWTKSDCDTL